MLNLIFAVVCLAQVEPAAPPQLRLIAHRGGVVDDRRIENSQAAVEEAIARGYWMLEVDVRRSKDGVPIAHHDRDFMRYYGDPRRVDEMTADQIARLRSPQGAAPLTLDEYAALCAGRIRVMLDVKVDGDAAFLSAVESILKKHDLLDTAWLLGPDSAKHHFAGRVRASTGARELAAAAERGETELGRRYFLFGIAARITDDDIRLARRLAVDVVPAVNTFRYEGPDVMAQAAADVRRLRGQNVECFQIDSVYQPLFSGTP